MSDKECIYADAFNLSSRCLMLFDIFVFKMVFAPIEMLYIENMKPLLWNFLMIVFSLLNQTLVVVLLTSFIIEALLLVSI